MVVDDNENAADALTAYLSLENFDIQTAYGGRQAVDAATLWLPHLIIMDISMPECNGFDAALELRADLRTRDIAIIAFTALDEVEVRRHLTDHEFDGYCQKGQPPSRLVALLMQLAN
jgi:two-component system OmpR family response regulator